MDERVVSQETTEAMQQAGFHPALIYAYQQTGLIITESNMKKFSGQDREEWDATHSEESEY